LNDVAEKLGAQVDNSSKVKDVIIALLKYAALQPDLKKTSARRSNQNQLETAAIAAVDVLAKKR
jgi:hypothetical protein